MSEDKLPESYVAGHEKVKGLHHAHSITSSHGKYVPDRRTRFSDENVPSGEDAKLGREVGDSIRAIQENERFGRKLEERRRERIAPRTKPARTELTELAQTESAKPDADAVRKAEVARLQEEANAKRRTRAQTDSSSSREVVNTATMTTNSAESAQLQASKPEPQVVKPASRPGLRQQLNSVWTLFTSFFTGNSQTESPVRSSQGPMRTPDTA